MASPYGGLVAFPPVPPSTSAPQAPLSLAQVQSTQGALWPAQTQPQGHAQGQGQGVSASVNRTGNGVMVTLGVGAKTGLLRSFAIALVPCTVLL